MCAPNLVTSLTRCWYSFTSKEYLQLVSLDCSISSAHLRGCDDRIHSRSQRQAQIRRPMASKADVAELSGRRRTRGRRAWATAAEPGDVIRGQREVML